MGLETKSNKRNKEHCQLTKDKETNPNPLTNTTATISANSSPRKSRRRNRRLSMTPVQRLFETCKGVFSSGGPGIVPSPENIEKLQAVLDDFKPGDVGLAPNMPYFRSTVGRQTPAITYLHLYECDQFSIGIFCLPPSGVLPLHNHPGMTVFSKLLFGTLHKKSYDWVADAPCASAIMNSEGKHPDVQLAKMKVDSDFTAPCDTSILYPSDGGNLHCFTAVTQCALLDVLGPPYSTPDGRHCMYYYDFPYTHFSVDGLSVPEEERERYAWLQEREKPEDLAVVGALYRGPQIVDK
ncbi:2-aminoethanethiol dioxygenase-like [Tripterygium wilfordii]|uniref:cysteine dioxygenase n=1 Tax=Tripterygium wilfordii TaxID=458696 RepID=A0A7J7DS92_TRIWF|nr:plant cysteine oxidase 2-like [Tripterygium wilfordii]XP_038698181.1 plant cysteine oxidase 2-like [Tripterygium wilfordii]XP_038698182.1 plant cysteine oxidase 2-like [Tripterygium wilfordii]XP_038698183.1 plant cysteine oxidase 2-like [Tripterygium wilfordii]KAF5749014.1 2-aminoethanethiol dioxygenase-like [Tripterygium wilfordii]